MISRILIAIACALLALSQSAVASTLHPSEPIAQTACQASADYQKNLSPETYSDARCKRVYNDPNPQAAWVCEAYITSAQVWSSCPDIDGVHLFPIGTSCDPGFGADPLKPSECLTQQKCLARNANLGANGSLPRPSLVTQKCNAGCKFTMGSDPSKYDTTTSPISDGTTRTVYRGVMEYSGDPCQDAPVDPNWSQSKDTNPDDQACQGVNGQSLCVKKDGSHCYTASTNRMICWTPGETGEKTDAGTMQKRNAGPTEIPPANLNLPSGDTLQKQGNSVTSSTTINNNTSTTTTTNYTTINGTNAGEKNQGQTNNGQTGSGTATGGGSGDGDDKDSKKNSASGGRTCEQPLQTAGDPLLGEIAQQQFLMRCGDGSGEPNPSKYTGADTVPGGIIADHTAGTDGLDTTGFGYGGTCPTIPSVNVMGQTLNFNTSVFCDWMQLGGYFVLIVAAMVSIRIMTSTGG